MKSSRRRSREFALQALYQWQVNGSNADSLISQLSEGEGYAKIDQAYFAELIKGTITSASDLEQKISQHLDRPLKQLSPVERGILMLACYELTTQLDVPYKVIINEGIELAKTFGGTDGHKYVNGVLDKIAPTLRGEEITQASQTARHKA
ncbi:MAG: transcription antitermination factor NusB [Burkholderiales bacterium]